VDWIAALGNTFTCLANCIHRNAGGRPLSGAVSGDSYWYPAVIGNTGDGLYFIRYDDGDTEWRMEKYIKKEEIRAGDVVFGNWQGKGRYYRGVIASRNGERIYIKYDDGDEEWTTVGRVRLR
jgi:hypothetical protein